MSDETDIGKRDKVGFVLARRIRADCPHCSWYSDVWLSGGAYGSNVTVDFCPVCGHCLLDPEPMSDVRETVTVSTSEVREALKELKDGVDLLREALGIDDEEDDE